MRKDKGYLPCDWHFHWENKNGVGDLELKGLVFEAAYDRAFRSGWREPVWYKPWTWNNWVKTVDN